MTRAKRIRTSTARPRVLMSYSTAKNSLNPFTRLLSGAIEEAGGEALDFRWTTALFGRYDLIHLHWPEHLLMGRRGVRRPAVRLALLLIIARSRITRTPIVRTVHNLEPHGGVSGFDARCLAWVDRATDHWVLMNRSVVDPNRRESVIPHGDYAPWLDRFVPSPIPAETRVDGRTELLFFGLIKRYKGVEELIGAVLDSPRDSPLMLRIRGTASDAELAAEIERLCAPDPRIDLEFGRIGDQELIDAIHASDVVVLPYRALYNSGVLLLALSCGRPVVVPEGDVANELAAEFGDEWVIRYRPPLDPSDLLLLSQRARPSVAPDLRGRNWSAIGRQHLHLYTSIISRSGAPTP